MTRRRAAACALALVVAAAIAPGASAHKFHASLAEVEHNPESRRLEIAMRLFADDLESALTRRAGRRVRLDATPGADGLVLDYVREVLVLRDTDGHAFELAWVGMELRVDAVWVYVEASAPRGLAGATVANRIFFELFADQVNTVTVKRDGSRASLVFTPGDGEKPIE